MKNNKWILTRTMNLGYCRETFHAGAVIEEFDDYLMVNGRQYNDTRDLAILKSQMLKNPDDAWIIPYSKEDEARLLNTGKTDVVVRKRPPTDHSMPVISSDDDLIEAIDVSNTQVSVINERKKIEAREAAKNSPMEIIPDQEDVEERIRRIAGRSDAEAVAERVALKSGGIQKMTVVHDDTLGAQYNSKKNPSLNAGMVIPSKHIEPPKPQTPVVRESEDEEVLGVRGSLIETVLKKVLNEKFGDVAELLEYIKNIKLIFEIVEENKANLENLKNTISTLTTLVIKLNALLPSNLINTVVTNTDNGNVETTVSDENDIVVSETDMADESNEFVEEAKTSKKGRSRKAKK